MNSLNRSSCCYSLSLSFHLYSPLRSQKKSSELISSSGSCVCLGLSHMQWWSIRRCAQSISLYWDYFRFISCFTLRTTHWVQHHHNDMSHRCYQIIECATLYFSCGFCFHSHRDDSPCHHPLLTCVLTAISSSSLPCFTTRQHTGEERKNKFIQFVILMSLKKFIYIYTRQWVDDARRREMEENEKRWLSFYEKLDDDDREEEETTEWI